MLDKFKIDDVVGAIPVHLIAGIWGTLAVPLTNSDANFGTQIISILIVGAFTFVVWHRMVCIKAAWHPSVRSRMRLPVSILRNWYGVLSRVFTVKKISLQYKCWGLFTFDVDHKLNKLNTARPYSLQL